MIWWPTEIPTLQHGLITLRPLHESDIPHIYEALQDPLIPKFTTIPSGYTIAHAEQFVREKAPISFIEKKEITFAITFDDAFAGVTSLHSINLSDHASEVGFWMTSHLRGKGICTTAAKLISEYGFMTMGFQRIEGIVDVENAPSRAVFLSAGYELEGIMRKKVTRNDGRQVDMALYSKIAD